LIQTIIDKLMKVVGFDNLLGNIPGGGFMLDLMKKAAEAAWNGFKSWTAKALDKINPLDDILGGLRNLFGGARGMVNDVNPAAKVYDGGGWLERTAGPQLVHHRLAKPDAVLSYGQWQDIHKLARSNSGGSSAPLVGTLNAFDADEAMRKLAFEQGKREALFNV